MNLFHMTCPACGANIDAKITSRIVTCAYCDSRFVIDDGDDSFVDNLMKSQEDLEAIELPMVEYAAQQCERFLDNVDRDHFKSASTILRGLGVGYEEVFLIHDDTLFHSGKNGFAITERGVYCRDMCEEPEFYPWEEFARMDKPSHDSSHITCGEHNVCYFTDDKDIFEELVPLYEKLHHHAATIWGQSPNGC